MNELEKAFGSYLRGKAAIFDYFKYVEEWEDYPIDDYRNCFWRIKGGIVGFSFSERLLSADPYEGDEFEEPIIGKVYRAEDYTLVAVDTQCDGNKYLGIFDNKKERPIK